jgi:hypothetical protein
MSSLEEVTNAGVACVLGVDDNKIIRQTIFIVGSVYCIDHTDHQYNREIEEYARKQISPKTYLLFAVHHYLPGCV